jgi:hypothetical protein
MSICRSCCRNKVPELYTSIWIQNDFSVLTFLLMSLASQLSILNSKTFLDISYVEMCLLGINNKKLIKNKFAKFCV